MSRFDTSGQQTDSREGCDVLSLMAVGEEWSSIHGLLGFIYFIYLVLKKAMETYDKRKKNEKKNKENKQNAQLNAQNNCGRF